MLHLGSSLFPGDDSSSPSVTAAFRQTWQEHHPEGDLATNPVPHLTAGHTDPAAHAPAQADAFARRLTLIDELDHAEAALTGVPTEWDSMPAEEPTGRGGAQHVQLTQ
ncbi:NAD(P)H-dependent oxidoreductase [Streptomyces sp. NPDC057428]|uniref:NAD(P)H-dependent oxidoreductase n=1 Tax=Streptomyces sp. NPDC057428 TaxID=3346129 RepID=UPI0036824261